MASDCLFCRIVAGEIPSDQVYADEQVIAFRDIAPKAPIHVLVIPRRHIDSVADLGEAARRWPPRWSPSRTRSHGARASPSRAIGSSRTSARTPARASATSTSTCSAGRRMTWPPG